MKRAVLLAFLLAGCQTNAAPAPQPEMTWCQKAMTLLGNRHGDPFQKQALLEKMRNEGCLDRR